MAPFANVTVFVDVSAKGDVKEKALMLAGSSSYYIGKPLFVRTEVMEGRAAVCSPGVCLAAQTICMSPEPCCWELTTPARWAESLYVLPPALTEEHDVRGSGIPWGQLPGLYSSQHLVSADHSLAGQPEKQKKPSRCVSTVQEQL